MMTFPLICAERQNHFLLAMPLLSFSFFFCWQRCVL